MRRNTLTKCLCVAVIAFALVSCKAKKAVVAPPPPPKPIEAPVDNSKAELFNSINARQANFATLNVKAKANLNIDNNANDVTLNIRIKQDAVIWVSVTAIAGVEVARALITPDSVKIMNRIDNIYIKKPFSYIYTFTNDQLNFKTLQAILVGNVIDGILSDNSAVSGDGQKAVITGMLTGLAYDIRFNATNKVTQTNLTDSDKGQDLKVDYGDFAQEGTQILPHFVKVQSKAANKSIVAEMRYSNIKLNEALDFPFNVPKRFSVKN